MAHLASKTGEVGRTDPSVSRSVILLVFPLYFSLPSFWRTLTFTVLVPPCCDCLEENVVIVLVKIEKRGSPVCRDTLIFA